MSELLSLHDGLAIGLYVVSGIGLWLIKRCVAKLDKIGETLVEHGERIVSLEARSGMIDRRARVKEHA